MSGTIKKTAASTSKQTAAAKAKEATATTDQAADADSTKQPSTGDGQQPVAEPQTDEQAQAEQEALAKADAEAKAKEETEAQAKADAEAKAKEEAEAKAKAEDEALAKQQKEQSDVSKQAKDDEPLLDTNGVPAGVLGALKVRSIADAGFWRCGVKFHRNKETLVLVVDGESQGQPAAVDAKDFPPEFVVFMSAEKAKRVHDEPRLVVETVELEDVIDIQD